MRLPQQEQSLSQHEQELCHQLRDFPRTFNNRFDENASRHLLQLLFRSLAGFNDDLLSLFFPNGPPSHHSLEPWSLRQAQGALEGAEYTEAARGHPCGHIFKSGEATYRCKTCAVDETCVLCARCFDASDHESHTVFVSVSPGNSGCCDCGDTEAWIHPVPCNIHTAKAEGISRAPGKQKEGSPLPDHLIESIRITISRVLDYFCDVFSCSPEQLRLAKTEKSVREDEESSRLRSSIYGGLDSQEVDQEFALVLWNDEKHTVNDVRDQVARACKQNKFFGMAKAIEVDDVGRSVVIYGTDVLALLRMAKTIEDIKLTVTIRSARDTFREQMCGTIVEWISDIAGCSVGLDHQILRNTICEEMLKAWRQGSSAHHEQVGKDGLYDHEVEENLNNHLFSGRLENIMRGATVVTENRDGPDGTDDDFDQDDADNEWEENLGDADGMDIDSEPAGPSEYPDGDVDMDASDAPEDELEASEATLAGYPPPPPPPPPPPRWPRREVIDTPADSDGEPMVVSSVNQHELLEVPKTPRIPQKKRPSRPPKHWLEKPRGYDSKEPVPLHENLRQRVRLDYMILFDLRMWKKVRVDIRDVFISTVVTIPHFKRVLGLRFAGLYTTLAQLYLIADREPDHSILNLSLQMLTTASITDEVVERGNFLTNLLAILYTFLTTRQVGYPIAVNPLATLAFEQGAVTNRRIYHFFLDMRYLLGSEHVKEKLCEQPRYLLQFLDLVKLHQGICPNIRAVGEHLEYETDAWISASLITREINKLCRQFSESFTWTVDGDNTNICNAIRIATKVVMINSMGAERRRFDQSEIKKETKFKTLDRFEFEQVPSGPHRIVDFTVAQEPMSFHHALHYTFSWLVDRGRSMSKEQLIALLSFSSQQLKEPPVPLRAQIPDCDADEYLLTLFDYPLRVCAWLAQMRANTWIRNGITLRHQMTTYRGVIQRDVSFQRDIFLLQIGLVVCPPTRFLASMVDRFAMTNWIMGRYEAKNSQGFENQQILDIAEDFVHLLIILLSDRTALLPLEDEPNPQLASVRRDIAHILCFKPLSHSDLTNRLSDKVQELDEFQELLKQMTVFRAPEGLSDSGTFALKEQYQEEIDPYIAQYSRNQREEAESIYKKHMAKKTGKEPSDIVFVPKLRPIRNGLFKDVAAFTRLPLFTQIIYYLLGYALKSPEVHPDIPVTKVEAYLQFVLQLVLVAIPDDENAENDNRDGTGTSFAFNVIQKQSKHGETSTVLAMLHKIADMEQFKTCEPKVNLILRRLQRREPQAFVAGLTVLNISPDRMNTSSPANPNAQDKELKKQQALDRQARVMASFKQQQSTFLANQAIDWGEDDYSDIEEDVLEPVSEEEKLWKYPTGTCILCQEETNDQRLYGTFSYITESHILRQTDTSDIDWVSEIVDTSDSLDRSAENIRPFGVSGKNRRMVTKVTSEGKTTTTERQDLSKGFSPRFTKPGPVATGCGHMMHYNCFEVYVQATQRRHLNQIARNHPERPDAKEFLCPLCKALGNAFLPIIWKGKSESYPGALKQANTYSFDQWLGRGVPVHISKIDKGPERTSPDTPQVLSRLQKLFYEYGTQEMVPPLASKLSGINRPSQFSSLASAPPIPPQPHVQPHRAPPTFFGRLAQDDPRDPVIVNPRELPSVSSEASSTPTQQASPIYELVKIYQRLRDTMKVNDLKSRYAYNPSPANTVEDLTFTDTLAECLGYSISATEISQRGVESEVGMTLLDKISPLALTHLRVLSETVSSYTTIGGLRSQGQSNTSQEFLNTQTRQLHQLFVGHPQIFTEHDINPDPKSPESILSQDAFMFFTECCTCIIPAMQLEVQHIMRICYIAEMVRVVLAFSGDKKRSGEGIKATLGTFKFIGDGEKRRNAQIFVQRIMNAARDPTFRYPEDHRILTGDDVPVDEIELGFLQKAMMTYALPFLRKAAILMHVRYGVDFPNTGLSQSNMSEFQRLTMALKLPTLDEIFESFVGPTEGSVVLRSIIAGWIRQLIWSRDGSPLSIDTLSHPAIFELVGLPKNYDTLTDEAIRRRCPTTGKELTDPCVCLFCGDIFCSQGVCCMKDGSRGGSFQHHKKCGGNVGIFINIRKCMVLFLNLTHGTWAVAPYLDTYGETDPTLRRHNQLFLHQKRYDVLLRSVWLNHMIPTTIARRLEGEVNNGGWETL